MIALGEDGDFKSRIAPENIWKWQFHVEENDIETNSGTWYAVDRSIIDANIEKGVAQIFVSNMGQIEKARSYYPDNLVVLYLHATHATETKNHILAKINTDLEKEIIASNNCSIDEAKKYIETDTLMKKKIASQLAKKLEEIKKVHYDFLEYNCQIDHVLLNTGTKEDLVEQMRNLIAFYTS